MTKEGARFAQAVMIAVARSGSGLGGGMGVGNWGRGGSLDDGGGASTVAGDRRGSLMKGHSDDGEVGELMAGANGDSSAGLKSKSSP